MVNRCPAAIPPLLSFGIAFLGFSGTLSAESAIAQCDYRDRVLPRVTQLPANAPAIVVLPPQVLSARDAGDFAFTLTNSAMEPVASTTDTDPNGAYLLRPAATLAEGHHTVRFQNVCAYWQQSNTTKEEKVNVGPPVALPADIATAATANFSMGNACYPMIGNVLVSLSLTPEMHAYREVAQFTSTFRGERAFAAYGDHNITTTGKGFFAFEGVCEKDQPSIAGELVVFAHVAGAASDPTAFRTTLQIPYPYYGINDPKKIPMCPPIETTDAGVGAQPVANLDASATMSPTRDEDQGCSYGGGRHSRGVFGGLIIVMFMVVRRRGRGW